MAYHHRAPILKRGMAVVLVIDDDPDLVSAVEMVLSDEGHTVVTAEDADTAVAAAREHDPALILMDWNLPGGGADLIARLREVTGARIALATGMSFDADEARRLGADLLLKKPYSVERLLDTVGEQPPLG